MYLNQQQRLESRTLTRTASPTRYRYNSQVYSALVILQTNRTKVREEVIQQEAKTKQSHTRARVVTN